MKLPTWILSARVMFGLCLVVFGATEGLSADVGLWPTSEAKKVTSVAAPEDRHAFPAERFSPATCHDPNAVCVRFQIPETLMERPEALMVGFYRSLPAEGEPDIFPPLRIEAPSLEAGGTLELILEADAVGTYQIYAVVYMPGGGMAEWRPRTGMDYVASSEPLVLTGAPLFVKEPLVFSLSR